MNDGGPAFPLPAVPPTATQTGHLGGWHHTPFIPANEGMSLRDYFATAALTAYRTAYWQWYMQIGKNGPFADPAEIAKWAYADADAMLKKRDEPQEKGSS